MADPIIVSGDELFTYDLSPQYPSIAHIAINGVTQAGKIAFGTMIGAGLSEFSNGWNDQTYDPSKTSSLKFTSSDASMNVKVSPTKLMGQTATTWTNSFKSKDGTVSFTGSDTLTDTRFSPDNISSYAWGSSSAFTYKNLRGAGAADDISSTLTYSDTGWHGSDNSWTLNGRFTQAYKIDGRSLASSATLGIDVKATNNNGIYTNTWKTTSNFLSYKFSDASVVDEAPNPNGKFDLTFSGKIASTATYTDPSNSALSVDYDLRNIAFSDTAFNFLKVQTASAKFTITGDSFDDMAAIPNLGTTEQNNYETVRQDFFGTLFDGVATSEDAKSIAGNILQYGSNVITSSRTAGWDENSDGIANMGDFIFSQGKNDSIKGSNFDDFIWGGADQDTVTGGKGVDTFSFFNDDIVRTQNIMGFDRITDFKSGTDKLYFQDGLQYDATNSGASGTVSFVKGVLYAYIDNNPGWDGGVVLGGVKSITANDFGAGSWGFGVNT